MNLIMLSLPYRFTAKLNVEYMELPYQASTTQLQKIQSMTNNFR